MSCLAAECLLPWLLQRLFQPRHRGFAPMISMKDRQSIARSILYRAGILPVITVESLDQASYLADALSNGGLTVLELTLRTPVALDALAKLKHQWPQLCLGAGTVLTAAQIQRALDAGADFLVTPGTPTALAQQLAQADCPIIPGAATATELIALQTLGFNVCKLFPASAVGGLQMVKALAGPLPGLSLCPTGGITAATAPDYLKQTNVACVGGSWMVQKTWIEQQNWAAIKASAAEAVQLVAAARKA